MISRILFLFVFILTQSSWAYVPKLSTILSKMASNNGGNKAFLIKRTVTLKEENVIANETWYVSHADLMKLVVEGTDADGTSWVFEILYKGGKRTTTSVEGKNQSFPLSPEFFEPLLHYRSSRALLSRLTSMQIIPNSISTDQSSPAFMNLDRYKGGVTYVLGAQDSKNTLQPPRIWVEQDSFLIRKLRLGSQIEVEMDAFKDFEEGKIKQPELQTIFWKNSTVVIQNTSTQLVEQKKVESFMKIQKDSKATLPQNASLKEFYSRFR
jgi:hypothetical protein